MIDAKPRTQNTKQKLSDTRKNLPREQKGYTQFNLHSLNFFISTFFNFLNSKPVLFLISIVPLHLDPLFML